MEFDYIIIGSGPAGSILSKELSDSGFKVALIDRAQNKRTSSINDFFAHILIIVQNIIHQCSVTH